MTGRHLTRVLALSLAGAFSVHRSAAAQIRGMATFREHTALPPGAVFEAVLEETSRGDGRGAVVGSTRIERPRTPPIRFNIPFDASRIDPGQRYVVRARVLVGARPMFVSERSYPVLTAGQGRQVAVLLHRSGGRESAEDEPSAREPLALEPSVREPSSREPSAREPAASGIGPIGSRSAIFTGELPCADCVGVRHQLELFPDESFFLRRTYVGRGRGAASDDIGRWSLSRDGRTLTLSGTLDAPLRLAIGNPNTLRMLGDAGSSGTSSGTSSRAAELKLTSRAQPLEPRLRMRGMYRYMADAGRFTECLTGQSWPVAPERDNAALESAYSRARSGRGDEVLVEVEGRVVMRPAMEGSGRQRTLVVERFDGVSAGERCGSRASSEPLENTYWKLTRVGDMTVTADDGEREPHLVLNSATGRVSGAAVCNRLLGRYEATGARLTFSDVATTRMACPSGMEVERQFLAALRASNTARITRQRLDLFDARGKLLARFEAKHEN